MSSPHQERPAGPHARGLVQRPDRVRGEEESPPLHALQQTIGNSEVTALLTKDKAVQRRVGGTSADPAAPERTRVALTGAYEVVDPGSSNRVLLQLNQAGSHIEGWWQQHHGQGGGRAQRYSSFRVHGGWVSDDAEGSTFAYWRDSGEGSEARAIGSIRARNTDSGVTLSLEEGSRRLEMRQTGTRATLSDRALASLPPETRELLTASERFRLDEAEEALIVVAAEQLETWVRRYLATTTANIARDVVASNMGREIRATLAPFGPEQRALALRQLRSLLFDVVVGGEETAVERSVWDWSVIIASSHGNFSLELANALGIRQLDGLGADAPQHKYRYMTSIVGLGGEVVVVGLGGYLGVFVIEKLEPEPWTQRFFTVTGQVSAGVGAGVNVGQTSNWSEFESPIDWRPANFRGAYAVMSAQAGAAAVIGAQYQAGGAIFFYGDGSLPPISAPADGAALLYGVQVGADVAEQGGYLWGGEAEALRNTSSAAAAQAPVEGEGSYEHASAVHFPLNDPSLTPVGRDAIRRVAAEERAAFENAGTSLRVDGHASPTGTVERDETLARLRAANVLQAFRDVLGDGFGVPNNHVTVEGHGHRAAEAAGAERGTETESWRRVDVTLNGRIVLTLH